MIKIDVYSGFLGAGKTSLIRKMISEAYQGEKLVLIENEFGDIAIDGGFLQDAGVQITEMNSGCICCSLVGDFGKALHQVAEQFQPDRILIEPSGVGKLSEVLAAIRNAGDEFTLNATVTLVDATKCKIYLKNFGEFYRDQLETAGAVVLSRTASISPEKLETCLALIREINPEVTVVTTPWDQLSGGQLLEVMEHSATLHGALEQLARETLEEHEHHHEDGECCHGHHHEGGECEHGHHHEDGECCHGHHHEHGECGHEHHHEHGEACGCGHHHHGHDADEVFTSWGVETPHKFTREQLDSILGVLDEDATYGTILRAKGIVPAEDGSWLHFDYVPEEHEIREGSAAVTGRICVIGAKLDEAALRTLFGL